MSVVSERAQDKTSGAAPCRSPLPPLTGATFFQGYRKPRLQSRLPELLGLGLFEALVCSLLMYQLLAEPAGGSLHLLAASQAVVLALVVGLLSFAVGSYSPDLYSATGSLLVSTSLAAVPALCGIAWAIGVDVRWILTDRPLLALEVLAGWTLAVVTARLGFRLAMRTNLFVRRVLVIAAGRGSDAAASRLVTALQAARHGFCEVAAVVDLRDVGRLTPGLLARRRIRDVVISADARAALAPERVAALKGCRVWSEVGFWESRLRRIDIDHPAGAWQPQDVRAPGRLDAALSRFTDILVALTLIGFTLPLMLLTALLVKLDSPGPAIYRQERVGMGGRPFIVLKFRSMRADAEARGPVWASQHDARVTRVGGFIRLTRIDELPQLFNVLRGEMSIVGPRPERPHFVAQLAGQVPHYHERARVKPGLTGWAQINYPYGASVEDARHKLSYDLYYVKHRSLLLNLVILLSTVRVVLFQTGAR